MRKGEMPGWVLIIMIALITLVIILLVAKSVQGQTYLYWESISGSGVSAAYKIQNTTEPLITYDHGNFQMDVSIRTKNYERMNFFAFLEARDDKSKTIGCSYKYYEKTNKDDISIRVPVENPGINTLKLSFWKDSECTEGFFDVIKQKQCDEDINFNSLRTLCTEDFLGSISDLRVHIS